MLDKPALAQVAGPLRRLPPRATRTGFSSWGAICFGSGGGGSPGNRYAVGKKVFEIDQPFAMLADNFQGVAVIFVGIGIDHDSRESLTRLIACILMLEGQPAFFFSEVLTRSIRLIFSSLAESQHVFAGIFIVAIKVKPVQNFGRHPHHFPPWALRFALLQLITSAGPARIKKQLFHSCKARKKRSSGQNASRNFSDCCARALGIARRICFTRRWRTTSSSSSSIC